jgi:hypothetical protein
VSHSTKKILIIASVAHAINAAMQAALGQVSEDWNHAPEEIRQSAVAGVNYHLENPDVTPEQSHESWLNHRAANGWVYGEVKDVTAKTHPCMVPFAELPIGEKAKDHLFRAVVHSLKNLPLEVLEARSPDLLPAPAAPSLVAVPRGFIPIQYIGPREVYKDGAYGTGLTFTRGQTLPVPAAVAGKMLLHPDVYVVGTLEAPATDAQQAVADAEGAVKAAKDAQDVKDDQENQVQDQRDSIERMTSKASVAEFVKNQYRQDLDPKTMKLAEMKAKAIQLIDQFGVA